MSASSPAADSCPNCGASLSPGARFCHSCGVRVASDTGVRVEPHWYGVTPPHLLLGVAAGALVLAVIFFATGRWPFGLILLGVGTLLVAAFFDVARRRPRSGVARASLDARERARSGLETLRARSVAAAEARRIQTALMLLETERRSALHDLGAAAHAQDSPWEADARARLADLDAREAGLRTELEQALEDAGERIRKARLPVQETVMVLPSEPYPPPDEANPPQPAVVPEPYPPPDEATPPEPPPAPNPERE
jgi:hypothetical protein